MFHLFRVLFLLINLDQKTVLNWFGLESSNTFFEESKTDIVNVVTDQTYPESKISIETLQLLIKELWDKVQDGLTLFDIENILFFIIFVRFIILVIKYNLKTSFYITCIGLFTGYLWYRHLIDLISMYRSILIKLPYLHKLGMDAVQLRSMSRQIILTNLKLGDNVHWYNPGQMIYYAIIRGSSYVNPETGLQYYIDPISMIISNLKKSDQANILPIYYNIYNKLIPQILESCSKFWTQLSGIAAYAIITRIGKKYCPYLVRWHWTFLLIVGFLEQILIYFVYRVSYFQGAVLIPQTQVLTNYIDRALILQINSLNGLITFIVFFHMGFVFFGLLHALCGQYFYFPFLVENTELHIGPRPKTSIFSGGYTSWQDEKEKNVERFFPKLWYGWFGKENKLNFFYSVKIIIGNFFKKLSKKLRR